MSDLSVMSLSAKPDRLEYHDTNSQDSMLSDLLLPQHFFSHHK